MALAADRPSPEPSGPAPDPAPAPLSPPAARRRPLRVQLAALAGLAILLWFIARQGVALYVEWDQLRGELADARASTVVGYPGIHPELSFAQRPRDWYREEGPHILLWSGWRPGVGHTWFRVARGEVDRGRISDPMGRDTVRAIDRPVVEVGGGTLWSRIPGEAVVVGGRLGEVETAYPLLVLSKVLIVNDEVGDHPFLVIYRPFHPADEQVAVYEPVVDGRRITMGTTGYFDGGSPIVYDRGTESFWVDTDGTMRAIAGAHKGATLKRLGVVRPVPWDRWRNEHPGTRLVVGADRSGSTPNL